MRRELLLIGAVAYWLFLLGWAAPALISASHWELVAGGVLLLIASAYITYRATNRAIHRKTTTEETQ
ncbi:hypothetical protein [Lysobacter sp. Hz 25]|uniref:hypothetical protein n=1 Tax=Lysobacter sp. Hz 25 TaxID=3383698 RepID=UPI0038D4D5B7